MTKMLAPCDACPHGKSCLAIERGHRPLCDPKYHATRQLHAEGKLCDPAARRKFGDHTTHLAKQIEAAGTRIIGDHEPRLPTTRPGNLAREIVVARYDEDLAWLDTIDDATHKTVYTKGRPIPGGIPLVNRAREAGTYLDHICLHYGHLADWVYFVQGTPHTPPGELAARMEVAYADATSMTAHYSDDWPPDEVKAKDRIEWHGGFEVRYGLVDPDRPGWCEAANLPSRTIWDAVFSGPMPGPFVFAYAAQWAVPRHRITDRPLRFWQGLRDRVNGAGTRFQGDPFSAHALEMLWLYLFSDPATYPGKMLGEPADPLPSPPPGRNYGWMHIARMGPWRTILVEQIAAIEASGILDATDAVYACLAGPREDFPYPSWMTILDDRDDLVMGECPTIARLWQHAIGRPSGKVWYVHTKGASHPPDTPTVTAWRRYMERYVIHGWRDCVRALDDHDACGVEWWTARTDKERAEHRRVWGSDARGTHGAFAGNFWWARMDYLAGLPRDAVDLATDRWGAEWRFLGVGSPNVKCFAGSGRNLYREYPADPKSKAPGVMAKAASFATAVGAHLADGMRPASADVQASRKAECFACPFHSLAGDTCTKCGCGLPLKRSWASSSCPDGRWVAEPAEGMAHV